MKLFTGILTKAENRVEVLETLHREFSRTFLRPPCGAKRDDIISFRYKSVMNTYCMPQIHALDVCVGILYVKDTCNAEK